MKNVSFLSSSLSHTDANSEVRVWNYGTPEYEYVKPYVDRINWQQIYKDTKSTKVCDRGNKAFSVGFATQDISRPCPITGVSMPGLNVNNKEYSYLFTVASMLLLVLSSGDDLSWENPFQKFLRALFHARLAISCLITSITIARQDENNPICFCHIDRNNSRSLQLKESVVIGKHIYSSEEAKHIRLTCICNPRKCIDDFGVRVSKVYPYIMYLREYIHQIASWRRGFNPLTYFNNVGNRGCIDGIVLLSDGCSNKLVYLATFADAIYQLHRKFTLTMYQMIELIGPISWAVEPYKYYHIISDWIKGGNLPTGCLTLEYCAHADRFYGGFSH